MHRIKFKYIYDYLFLPKIRPVAFVIRCFLMLFLFSFLTSQLKAANGDYRSIASSAWTTSTTWQADYGAGFVATTLPLRNFASTAASPVVELPVVKIPPAEPAEPTKPTDATETNLTV